MNEILLHWLALTQSFGRQKFRPKKIKFQDKVCFSWFDEKTVQIEKFSLNCLRKIKNKTKVIFIFPMYKSSKYCNTSKFWIKYKCNWWNSFIIQYFYYILFRKYFMIWRQKAKSRLVDLDDDLKLICFRISIEWFLTPHQSVKSFNNFQSSSFASGGFEI
jgi:hypothetical protein